MKQFNVWTLVSDLKQTLISYLASSLPVGNHSDQQHLGRRFFELWQKETFKGPFIETLPTYVLTSSLEQLSEVPDSSWNRRFFELLRPKHSWRSFEGQLGRFVSARDRLWMPGSEEAARECEKNTLSSLWTQHLYQHQFEAFSKISIDGANVIVATGTGSGKTEAFLIPLLYSLLTEPDAVRCQSGVRAILLYPMNALVEDQMRRLRRLLFWLNLQAQNTPSSLKRQITFGRYTGQTPINERDKHAERATSEEEIHELGEIRYRAEMQSKPPDILVTNFTMLEYMLLRNDDRALFQPSNVLKFLILDEVHSYSGTRGMEVATLLRRFRDYISRKSASVTYRCVGTSATLGSSSTACAEMARFATTLFGTNFSTSSVVTGSVVRSEKPQVETSSRSGWIDAVLNLPREAPAISKTFALARNQSGELDCEIPTSEWHGLAFLLNSKFALDEQYFSGAPEITEILGAILTSSSLFARLKASLERFEVRGMDSVAADVFGTEEFSKRPVEALNCLGVLLKLATAARINCRVPLAIRVHLFVKEHRHAYICLNPQHTKEARETDAWWANLSFVHRTNCSCTAIMYPLTLCRKCGFVFMEGWLRKGRIFPEKDELLGIGQFRRVLLRPVRSTTERFRDRMGDEQRIATLCTACGARFPHQQGKDEHREAAIRAHRCDSQLMLECLEWSSDTVDAAILECPYCEQTWLKGQEVITHPLLSLYGASTVILEEMKRAIDEPLEGTGLVNKALCFSDGRQQAAAIASRLQRTNEDFTFRQLMYQVLSEAETGMSTRTLINSLSSLIESRPALARLFCEVGETDDGTLTRRRIATLLFHETCIEYRTLESLGVCSISFSNEIRNAGLTFLANDRFAENLSDKERISLFNALMNWTFRFRRWAIHGGPLPFYGELEQYGYQDRAIMKFGISGANISGCSLKKSDSRNRMFDLYQRLCHRAARPWFPGRLEDFKRFMEAAWESVMSFPVLHGRARIAQQPPDDKPIVIIDGTDSETFKTKLNWFSLTWAITDERDAVFECDSCGAISRNSVLHVCHIRGCSGKLRETTLAGIRSKTFLPAPLSTAPD